MPVRSLDRLLEETVASLLEEHFTGSDLEVNYVAGFGQSASQCEHEEFVFEHVYRLCLWVGRMGGGEYSVSGTVPMTMVLSGDTDPIRLLVSEVCQRAEFGLVMVETGQPVEMVENDEEGRS